MTKLKDDESIIFKKPDGGIAVIYMKSGAGLEIEEIVQRAIPPETPWKIVKTADLPQDTIYRDAWEWED